MHDQHAEEEEHSNVPSGGEEESRARSTTEAEVPYLLEFFFGWVAGKLSRIDWWRCQRSVSG